MENPPGSPWLLAVRMADDGKGIFANDPATGQPAALGNGAPQAAGPNSTIPNAAWGSLGSFKPGCYFAVSI